MTILKCLMCGILFNAKAGGKFCKPCAYDKIVAREKERNKTK